MNLTLMFKLFTSKTCKYCPEVKKFLNLNDIEYLEYDVGVFGNREELIGLGGRGVPALLLHVEAGNKKEEILLVGKDDIINHFK